MLRMSECHGTYPRPRPATYDAGAGMERKANLFFLDAMCLDYSAVVGVCCTTIASHVFIPLHIHSGKQPALGQNR
jgi:hypothetical protein